MGKTSNHIQRNGKFFTGDLYSGKTTNRILEPAQPSINFDVTGDWSLAVDENQDPLPVTDQDSFVDFLESQGFTVNSISNFSLVDGRLSCVLNVSDSLFLSLGTLSITDIVKINAFFEIKNLYLNNNLLTVVPTSISELQFLEEIDFSDNQISTIENLDTLINLKYLLFINNQISVIENLDTLVNLEGLDLTGNQISVIENLDTLVNLFEIFLDNNQITVLEKLNTLVNLNQLNLTNNLIDTITDIDDLVNLTILSINDNQLTTSEFDKLNTWAVLNVNIGGSNVITTENNIDSFDTSTTHTTLLGKGWTITI